MKKIADTTPDRLYDIEVKALRMLNGELPDELGGAWFNACCGRLKHAGFATPIPYRITEEGKRFLEQLDAKP